MKPVTSQISYFRILYPVALLTMLGPIWLVNYFINSDGSGHINASFVMIELLKGNQFFTDFYAFNSPFVPNSIGHWLMVPLLLVFSPYAVTKLMMSVTFIAVVGAVVWLRRQIDGTRGLSTSFLIGCALSFNWLWFVGSYNFMLGLAGFAFTLGLYYRWREKISGIRCCGILALLTLVFFSHLISFFVLVGSIVFLSFFSSSLNRKQTILWTLAAVLSTFPLLLFYKALSAGGEAFDPVWRSLAEPYSIVSWITQIGAADPFILISRRTLPFTDLNSPFLAIFSPILWISGAILFLGFGAILGGRRRDILSRDLLPFAILFVLSMVAALLGPDDFGITNGGLLRHRILLAGLVFTIPLLHVTKKSLKYAANSCLIFVLLIQTAALWEYAIQTNSEVKDFVAAAAVIEADQKIASVIIIDKPIRFHSSPAVQMNNYLGIGKQVIVMDNYEMSHYLFPIVIRDQRIRRSVFDLVTSNVLFLDDPKTDIQKVISNLDLSLAENKDNINTLLLWGRNDRVESILMKNFEASPFYESGRVRLFHRLR